MPSPSLPPQLPSPPLPPPPFTKQQFSKPSNRSLKICQHQHDNNNNAKLKLVVKMLGLDAPPPPPPPPESPACAKQPEVLLRDVDGSNSVLDKRLGRLYGDTMVQEKQAEVQLVTDNKANTDMSLSNSDDSPHCFESECVSKDVSGNNINFEVNNNCHASNSKNQSGTGIFVGRGGQRRRRRKRSRSSYEDKSQLEHKVEKEVERDSWLHLSHHLHRTVAPTSNSINTDQSCIPSGASYYPQVPPSTGSCVPPATVFKPKGGSCLPFDSSKLPPNEVQVSRRSSQPACSDSTAISPLYCRRSPEKLVKSCEWRPGKTVDYGGVWSPGVVTEYGGDKEEGEFQPKLFDYGHGAEERGEELEGYKQEKVQSFVEKNEEVNKVENKQEQKAYSRRRLVGFF